MGTISQYKGVRTVLSKYWGIYGRWEALRNSPFLHFAVLLTVLCTPLWWSENWWEKSLSVIPTILGFSIAAFALLLGVGTDHFKMLIGTRNPKKAHSTLTKTSASFFHFVLVQAIAIVLALIASGRPLSWAFEALPGAELRDSVVLIVLSKTFRFAGFFFLSYALLTSIAATLSIFRLSTVFSKFATNQSAKPKSLQTPQSGQ